MTPTRIREWQRLHPERLREYNRRYHRTHKAKKPDPKVYALYRERYLLNLIQRYHLGEALTYWSMSRIKSRLNGTYKPHKRPKP